MTTDHRRSLRPENIAKLQEQLELEESWGVKPSVTLDFPLNDSSKGVGEGHGSTTDAFSEWQHFR